jgi:hypothetical protein
MAEKRSSDSSKRSKDKIDLAALRKRISDMDAQRQPLIAVWEDISKYIIPGRGVFSQQEPNKAELKDKELLDPTPLQAIHILAAGMQGGLTSPSKPWFKLGVADPELSDEGDVRLWLDNVERRMMHVFAQSNIYNCLHTLYSETAGFGTGVMLVEEDPLSVIRCKTMTVGEYYLAYAANGLPETFARVFWMNAGQMSDTFGKDALSESAKTAAETRPDRWFRICHVVMPNMDRKLDSPLSGNMPYLSVYWEENRTDEPLLVMGYQEFPVMAPRWEVYGDDFYGRGPGWDALGESKTLQEMRYDFLIAQKMVIHPPLMASVSMRKARGSLKPGDITYLNSMDPLQGYRTIYEVKPDIPGQLQAMMDSRAMIRTTFFADLFLSIIMSGDKDMTAREVEERHAEKMMMLGPVLERLEYELLDPSIARTFAIMDRFGLIPPPPDVVKGRQLKIEYISTLAQSQQMSGLGGVDRLANFAGGVAQLVPAALDKLDVDEAIDQYARMLGVPAAIVRSDENVAGIRAQRQQEQQAMQQMAASQQMAETANKGAGAVKQAADAASSGGLDRIADIFAASEEEEEGETM